MPARSIAPAPTTGVRDFIRRWADTLLAGNLDEHMAFYAPMLERFNGDSHVARNSVRETKRLWIGTLEGVRRFEIHGMKLTMDDGLLRAGFRIEFDSARGAGARSYRLDLRQVNGKWMIHGEESGTYGMSISRRTDPK
jgi:hypothetical protein